MVCASLISSSVMLEEKQKTPKILLICKNDEWM